MNKLYLNTFLLQQNFIISIMTNSNISIIADFYKTKKLYNFQRQRDGGRKARRKPSKLKKRSEVVPEMDTRRRPESQKNLDKEKIIGFDQEREQSIKREVRSVNGTGKNCER